MLDYTADTIARNDLSLTIIGLKHDLTTFTDMREVARAANGVFIETDLEDIDEAFERAVQGL